VLREARGVQTTFQDFDVARRLRRRRAGVRLAAGEAMLLAPALQVLSALCEGEHLKRLKPLVAALLMAMGTSAAVVRAADGVEIAIGDARLEIDDTGLDEKLGGAFSPGLRSGANTCYVEALAQAAGQKGEIAFVVKPPKGEGRYVVDVEAKGSLHPALVECVRRVFDNFYHYRDKQPFDRVQGTLHFEPQTITAPAPPAAAELVASLEQRYAGGGVVRITKAILKSVSRDVERSSSEVFLRYIYDVDLEFTVDGFESTCHHYDVYKVFTQRPYKTPYAGHSCESQARAKGDHTAESVEIDLKLSYWPKVGTRWELPDRQATGTRPER
jgi:hypothetical protein